MKFLVTAGNTREMIDQVRDWGNIFTGNTGYAIARALAAFGEVELLTSNRSHLSEIASGLGLAHAVRGHAFSCHAELKRLLQQRMAGGNGAAYHAVYMSAAVADYRPRRTYSVLEQQINPDGSETWIVRDAQAGKVKSNHRLIAVLGEQTEKLVDLFRAEWKYSGLLVKFKLEVDIDESRLLEIGRQSRLASAADYLVANTLAMVDGPNAGAYLIGPDGERRIARAELAVTLATLAVKGGKASGSPHA
jgi:phosphopantothenoylcysteine synthetase/decarboxylase